MHLPFTIEALAALAAFMLAAFITKHPHVITAIVGVSQ